MKFSELESEVAALEGNEEQDIQVKKFGDRTVIRTFFSEDRADLFLYEISELIIGSFVELTDALILSPDHRLALQKLAYKYSRTPLNERRDEPKFLVRMLPGFVDDFFLNQVKGDAALFIGNDTNWPQVKTVFTKSEYTKQLYPQWLPKFDKDDPHFEFVEDGEYGADK